MATANTLHIVNHFDYPITIYVSQNGWNCCDAPAPGQAVGHVPASGSVDLVYCRKDGHGCDGCQGQFQLDINITMNVALDFDSDGGMNPACTATGCAAAISPYAGGQFQLIVFAAS